MYFAYALSSKEVGVVFVDPERLSALAAKLSNDLVSLPDIQKACEGFVCSVPAANGDGYSVGPTKLPPGFLTVYNIEPESERVDNYCQAIKLSSGCQ